MQYRQVKSNPILSRMIPRLHFWVKIRSVCRSVVLRIVGSNGCLKPRFANLIARAANSFGHSGRLPFWQNGICQQSSTASNDAPMLNFNLLESFNASHWARPYLSIHYTFTTKYLENFIVIAVLQTFWSVLNILSLFLWCLFPRRLPCGGKIVPLFACAQPACSRTEYRGFSFARYF